MEFKKGDVLKLTKKARDHIYRDYADGWDRAKRWRFEYRGEARRDPDCLTVLKLPQRYHHIYHKDFLELA